MKLFGVLAGIAYAWMGAVFGAFIIFMIARYLGGLLCDEKGSSKYLQKIDSWVQQRGAVGLLMIRLLPIPSSMVNYAAGLLPSIRLWDYLWTMAISILPYYFGVAFLYMGLPHKAIGMSTLGIVLIVALWMIIAQLNRQSRNLEV